MTNEFVVGERQRAVAWKSRTPLLPDEARADARYVRDGKADGSYPYCLPPAYAAYNLLPEVREVALDYFARRWPPQRDLVRDGWDLVGSRPPHRRFVAVCNRHRHPFGVASFKLAGLALAPSAGTSHDVV